MLSDSGVLTIVSTSTTRTLGTSHEMDRAALLSKMHYRMPFFIHKGALELLHNGGARSNKREGLLFYPYTNRTHKHTHTHTHISYLKCSESVTWTENFLPFLDHLLCGIFHQAASSPGYVASNNRIISHIINWKECGGKRS